MQQGFDFTFEVESRVIVADKWSQWLDNIHDDDDLDYAEPGQLSLAAKVEHSVQTIYQAIKQGYTLSLGYSSGKDSETVLHLMLMALIRACREGVNISEYHYVLHTDTGVENPIIRKLADRKLSALQEFIDKEGLPLSIVLAKPSISESWTGRVLTGRGLPTFAGSANRICTNDMKINPAKRAERQYLASCPNSIKRCLLLGSRDAESTRRKANLSARGASNVLSFVDGKAELYPIKSWFKDDVWELLLHSGADDKYPLPSYLNDNIETAEVYKSATGECIWSASDQRASEACSSRFGCWCCTATGVDDKSMQAMLESDPEKYGFMTLLNRIQRYIAKRQYAWEDRNLVGRTIHNGFVKICPDVYSPAFLKKLFRACVTADYLEAEQAEALGLYEPRFQIVSNEALIHVDFMWSLSGNFEPFEAIKIYREVWDGEKLELLEDEPTMVPVRQSPMPKPFWVRKREWRTGRYSGLADPIADMVAFDTDDKTLVDHIEGDSMMINSELADFVIWEEFDDRLKCKTDGYLSAYATQYYLRMGAVQIGKGRLATYHHMMQRTQGLADSNIVAGPDKEVLRQQGVRLYTNEEYKRYMARRNKAYSKRYLAYFCYIAIIYDAVNRNTAIGLQIIKDMQPTHLSNQCSLLSA